MDPTREKILVLAADDASRAALLELLGSAGYDVSAASEEQALEAARAGGASLVVLDAHLAGSGVSSLLAELGGSAKNSATRVLVVSDGGAEERARALDLGGDDVMSSPWDSAELLARVRAQVRAKHAFDTLREKTRLAEAGQEIAHTAFQALAVTEKMTRDAFSLARVLKIGVTAVLIVAAVMAGIFFLYSRRAERETRRAYGVIAQLSLDIAGQRDLVAESRRMREEFERFAPAEREELEKQAQQLRARIAGSDPANVDALRQQLRDTSTRLRRIEGESRVAQSIINSYAPSVCLLHAVVVFRDKNSGQRLRYGGINPQGEPLQDSEGKPIFTLGGRGPEVRAHFFGTGFLVAQGRILTNRHIVEPWWKNRELESIGHEGFQAVLAEISAYFPDSPRVYHVEIARVSPDADLAVVQGDLGDLKHLAPAVDDSRAAAISGQPVVSIGYATGLQGILARAGEEVVKTIVSETSGNPQQVLAELAGRNLIRPITTQGHIGDVLPDKIVYDAQTTSGGSGGPLFNHHGKVIAVTYAVVKGFGGSNFGVPVRFARPLLSP